MSRRDDLIAALAILAIAGVGMVALLPPAIFSFAYWQEGGDNTSRSEVLRNLGLAAIALGALIVGSIRALSAHRQARAASEQARIAEQGHFTERFSRAAEHLGDPALPVRLGGIYALWRLAQDSPKRDLTSVIDILCAFVRDPPHKLAEPTNAVKRVHSDVQAVLDLLGDEPVPYRQDLPADYWLDLTDANLSGYDLRDANFSKTDFRDADLSDAQLAGTNLTDASLKLANLKGAQLSGATITRANLTDATLTNADLMDADLTDARLTDADLTGARLRGANLRGARLRDANLTDANLMDAKLTGAQLRGAQLRGADLTDADLTNARLAGANLTDARLRVADLRGARLRGADLTGTELKNANLTGTYLAGANLTDADLMDANLTGANLTGAKNLTQQQLDAACISKSGTPPTLPEGLMPPQKVCVP